MVDKQTWSIHTVKYGPADKRKEILTQATTWMNLEDVMPSEISQIKKDKYCTTPRAVPRAVEAETGSCKRAPGAEGRECGVGI